MVFVGQSDTPDVSVRTVDIVESAEHQAIFDGTQLGEAILVHGGEGIAFGALRGRSVRAGSTHGVETGTSLGPQIIQAAVRAATGRNNSTSAIPSSQNLGTPMYPEASTKTDEGECDIAKQG